MKIISRLIISIIPAILFIYCFAFSAHAIYTSSGNILDLPKDKKIDETVLVSGSTLTVDSDINGDLLCAGQDVTVNSDIKGDVLCAAQTIKINGTVDGDVRVIGQAVEINGLVNRNVYTLSQNLSLTKFATIKGDIFFGVQNVDLRGVLGRDMLGAGEQITISGSLLRNAKVTASKLSLIDPAKIGGNFEYYIDSVGTASVSPKNVKGTIQRHEIVRPEAPKKDIQKVTAAAKVMGKIFWIISTIVLGLALIYFTKNSLGDRSQIILKKPFVTGLVGLAVLILTPVVFILLMITVIGIPFAFLLLLEYIVSIMISSIYSVILVGEWVIKMVTKKKISGYVWSLVAGSVVTGIVFMIPVISGLAGFIMLCLGLGAIFFSFLPEK